MIYKLRPSVAIVELEERIEFFLTNVRKSLILGDLTGIKAFLFKFDGKKDVLDIYNEVGLNEEQKKDAINLVEFLNQKNILIKIDEKYNKDYKKFSRVYNLLEDYNSSQSKVNNAFKKIQNSKVMIVGLGAVGTWVVHNLVMSGVKKLVLVDFDRVEKSNIHRQIGFFQKNIGQLKTEALKNRLIEFDKELEIEIINDKLDSNFFERYKFFDLALIVNCADYPNVDITSEIIGEYSMKKGIPHLIGGGYNLHMSLIGQAVIPGKTACINCFKKHLNEINKIDTKNIKKLEVKDRKIGSFTPLITLSASITSNEAIKILSKIDEIVMENNRCEFILKDMNFKNITLERRKDCEWCGEKGKFYKI